MQTLQWYFNRLKSMSAGEIIWRVDSFSKSLAETCRVASGKVPQPQFRESSSVEFVPGFRVTELNASCWTTDDLTQDEKRWLASLEAKASVILDNRLTFFDLENHFIRDPIDWHIDHANGIKGPLDHIMKVNYRDFEKFGDCKLVWEPNRHHQLVVLGRAFRATAKKEYAEAVVKQMSSWIESNPYGKGMNWRSPLEMGIRLINWVWAIDLILDSGVFAGTFKDRVIHSVYLHCRDISRKYSQGSSANNHLVGEAAGVFVASSYFDVFIESSDWAEESASFLEREIQAQTYKDGCTLEHALGYQFFVFQFYLIAGLVAQKRQREFDAVYCKTLRSILTFIAHLLEGGGTLPMFGDRDDGYVLDLGEAVHDGNALMNIGYQLFSEERFAGLVTGNSETAYWLFGKDVLNKAESVNVKHSGISSHRFEDSGYFLLQYGDLQRGDKVSILFDCAKLGYGSIAAHGHADALSFVMKLNDLDFLIDTGTYDYFSFPEWRNYFRSTKAHNTIEIDGQDQSVMQGSFMWTEHAKAHCKHWELNEVGANIVAEHNGYRRLTDPVIHQRSIELNGLEKSLTICDKLTSKNDHDAVLYFHLSPACEILGVEGNRCTVGLGEDVITIDLDCTLRVDVVNGARSKAGNSAAVGWYSGGYHEKVAINTIVAQASFQGDVSFHSKITWS